MKRGHCIYLYEDTQQVKPQQSYEHIVGHILCTWTENNKSKQTIKTSKTKDDNVTAVNVKLKYIVLEIYLEKI